MFSEIEIDALLESFRGRRREALLPALWKIQQAYGSISAEHVHQISHLLRVPEADIYGVIGFYHLFHDKPTGEKIIRVCTSPSCGLAGADAVLEGICNKLGIQEGETSDDGAYTVEHSPCLGMCDHAPAALVSTQGEMDVAYATVTVDSLLQSDSHSDYNNYIGANPSVLIDPQRTKPHTLAEYGDYVALQKVIQDESPETLIETVIASGLVGRGGAAFPTGLKWKFTRQPESTPKYVVCNADESEPGTFKDRILMEHYPHLLLEGIALAAYAIDAHEAYIFIRGEFPKGYAVLQRAIAEAEAAGWLGDNILKSDFSLKIHMRRGAGAYICGEETALFEAIEGKRGFPRIKPPYPTTFGLFGKPTIINNVETLCNVRGIVEYGADWFRQYGTEQSSGTKLVSVSGHVNRPGVYEISPGIPMRQFLDEFSGGIRGELKAILMGGAAGTFLTPDEIDVPLTFESLSAAGSTFGSGAIAVFNQTTDLRDVLKRLGHFFQHESCGKCFPCQLGTQRQVEILDRIEQPIAGDKQRLIDVGMTMTDASICALGQTASTAVLSAMEKFPEMFQA